MNRLWSLLFFSVPVLGLAIVLGAAFGIGPFQNKWLPESIGPRANSIDHLFVLINLIIGVVFIGTGLFLAMALWRFGGARNGAASNRSKNNLLEIVWSIIPAGVLIFLVFYQLPFWEENKVNHPAVIFTDDGSDPKLQPLARVEARQYGWRFIYPGRDMLFDTRDDIISEANLVVPVDETIVLELSSEDVIHSFCINELRLKQDVVPGMSPRVWFKIDSPGQWQVICTELCGPGHYRMTANITALSRQAFDSRLRELERAQFYYLIEAQTGVP